jgi:hypothetical protein
MPGVQLDAVLRRDGKGSHLAVSEAKLFRTVQILPSDEPQAMHVHCLMFYPWNAQD